MDLDVADASGRRGHDRAARRQGRARAGDPTALTQIAAHELDLPPEAVRAAAQHGVVTGRGPDRGSRRSRSPARRSGRVCADARVVPPCGRAGGLDIAQVRLASACSRPPTTPASGRMPTSPASSTSTSGGDPSLDVELAPPTSKDLAGSTCPTRCSGGALHPRLEFDSMLHARVVRPPGPGAHLEDADAAVDRVRPEVSSRWCATATSSPSSLGVRARPPRRPRHRPLQRRGLSRIELPASDDIAGLVAHRRAQTKLIRNDGARHDDASAVVAATYSRPYLALHGSIAPAVPSRITTTDASKSGATSCKACSPWAAPSRPPRDRPPRRCLSSTSRARAATATMPPTTSPWTPRCSRCGVPAATRRSLERPTRCPGSPSARPWSPTSPPASTSTGRSPTGHMSCRNNGHTARPGYAPRHGLLADAHRAGITMLRARPPSAVTARHATPSRTTTSAGST